MLICTRFDSVEALVRSLGSIPIRRVGIGCQPLWFMPERASYVLAFDLNSDLRSGVDERCAGMRGIGLNECR
jgi:hypothetical protein